MTRTEFKDEVTCAKNELVRWIVLTGIAFVILTMLAGCHSHSYRHQERCHHGYHR